MLEYAFMQNALLVSVLISLMCPMIGMFLVLRRYSMIGDTLAHASLAGVAVGLLVKVNPIISAFAVTSVFAVLIEVLRQRFRRYAELILVIILSLSVGIAITIISSGMVHTNVEAFLFGSILTVTPDDVLAVAVLCVVSLAAVYFLYPQLVMLAFDEDGYPMLYVFSNCKAFIRTIPLLVYDDVKVEDLDTDMEDHVADESRYACMSRPISPRVPPEAEVIEDDPLNMIADAKKRRR